MPTFDFKLASQRENTGGNPGGLRGSLLNPGAASGMRAPYVNPASADVRFNAAPVPRVVEDQTAKAVQDFGATFTRAAMQFAERQDRVRAQYALMGVKEQIEGDLNGRFDPETGRFTGGYLNSEGMVAVEGYKGFQARVDKVLQDKLELLTPKQKALALPQLAQARDRYLNKAAQHAAKQLTVEEEKVKGLQYNQVLTQITPDNLDIGGAQTALSAYADDPAEFAKRNAEITKKLLYSAWQKSPQEAQQVAQVLMATEGVGDAAVIYQFQRNVIQDRRAAIRFARENQTYQRSQGERVVKTRVETGYTTAIREGGEGLTTFFSNLSDPRVDPASEAAVVSSATPQAVQDAWSLSRQEGKSISEFAVEMRKAAESVPEQYRADFLQAVDKVEKQEHDRYLNELSFQEKQVNHEVKMVRLRTQDNINQFAEQINDLPPGDPRREAAYQAFMADNPAMTNEQRAQVDSIYTGSFPNRERELLEFEQSYETLSKHPATLLERIDSLNVPLKDKIRLRKQARLDIEKGAAEARKLGHKTLQAQFNLSPASGMFGVLSGDQYDKYNYYNRAIPEFNAEFDRLLRDKNGYTPEQAASMAMSEVMSRDWFQKAASKSILYHQSDGATYRTVVGSHDPALKAYGFSLKVPGLKGDPNLVKWFSDLKGKAGNKYDDVNPKLALDMRAKEVSDRLAQMAATAKTEKELQAILNAQTQHQAQYNYLQTLYEHAPTDLYSPGKVLRYIDGDTVEVVMAGFDNPVSIRQERIDTAEKDTAAGKEQAQQSRTVGGALTPVNPGMLSIQTGEQGYYGRPLGVYGLGQPGQPGFIDQSRLLQWVNPDVPDYKQPEAAK